LEIVTGATSTAAFGTVPSALVRECTIPGPMCARGKVFVLAQSGSMFFVSTASVAYHSIQGNGTAGNAALPTIHSHPAWHFRFAESTSGGN